jgi:hypothetical protein
VADCMDMVFFLVAWTSLLYCSPLSSVIWNVCLFTVVAWLPFKPLHFLPFPLTSCCCCEAAADFCSMAFFKFWLVGCKIGASGVVVC